MKKDENEKSPLLDLCENTSDSEVRAKYHALILRVRSEYLRTLEEECVCSKQIRKPATCGTCSLVSTSMLGNERIQFELSRVREEQAKSIADPEFLRMLEEEAAAY